MLYDYLDKAARVGNLALVQWLMAPERGAQQVEPSSAWFDQARESTYINNRAIKLWFEQQALQSKNSLAAAPVSAHSINQQPPRAESKLLVAGNPDFFQQHVYDSFFIRSGKDWGQPSS